MEKEGEKEGMTKEKDKGKEDDRKRKTDAKVSFLRKYYPDTHSSPGGSVQITRVQMVIVTGRQEKQNSKILSMKMV